MAYSKARRLAEIVSDTDGNLSVQGITVPTQSTSDNDTSAASTAFVHTHINALIDSAPGTMNTLNEIAAALNDDADFNTTVTNSIAAKLPLAGGTMSGALNMGTQNITNIGRLSTADGIGDTGSAGSSTVFNESGSTADFRIESTNNANAFFLDGGLDRIGIFQASPAAELHVNGNILLNNANEIRQKDTGGNVRTVLRINSSNDLEYGYSGSGAVKFMGGGSYTEKIRIHTNGSVGINQTQPSTTFQLDVGGQVRSTGNSPAFNLRDDDSSNQHWQIGSYGGVFAVRNVTGSSYPLQINGSNVGIGTSPNFASGGGLEIERAGVTTLRMQNTSSKSVELTQDEHFKIEAMNSNQDILLAPTRNVGIGTTSPDALLEVERAGSHTSSDSIFRITGQTYPSIEFYSRDSNSTNRNWKIASVYNSYGTLEFLRSSAANGAPNVSTLAMTSAGRVGIGVTAPSQMLEVNGIGKFTTTHHTATTVAAYLGNSATGTYNQTTTYAHQNNSSGNFNNGIHIEMGRITDSSSAEIRAFVVGARGGQSAFKVLGNDKQAGVTQDDGDYLTRMWVTGGDGYLSLYTGEGSPVERTKLASYGTSFINSNSNGLSSSPNALIIGSDATKKSGSLHVKGSSTSGGILTRTDSAGIYKDVCTSFTTGSSNRYWHIKTNITTSMNIMFVAHVEGYSYGNSGAIMDVKRSGYMYSPNSAVINTTTENFSGVGGLNLYNSSDNYLVFVADFSAGYYSGGRFHMEFPSPAGYTMDLQILAHVMNSTSTGHY